MSEINSGFKARLEYVLNQICVEAPDGGSHEMRRFIAEKIMAAAETGERSLERLTEVSVRRYMFLPVVFSEDCVSLALLTHPFADDVTGSRNPSAGREPG